MHNFVDEDFDNMSLAEGALALNEAIDPSTDVLWAKQELDRLAHEAEQALSVEVDEYQRFDALLRLFYQQWQFKEDVDNYYSSQNGFVDRVLKRRKGVPVSLGVIFIYLANRLNLPVSGVVFPTQFIVRIDWPDRPVRFINPANGDYVSTHVLHAWLKGKEGQLAELKAEYLQKSDHPTVIGRWLGMCKNMLLQEEKYDLALACTNLALVLVPDDPYEIRDRGFIYQQLDCPQIAANDFQFFVEQCPNDPVTDLLKTQISDLNHTPVTLH